MIIVILSLITLSLFLTARLALYFIYFRKQKPFTRKELLYSMRRGVRFDLSIFATLFGLPAILAFLPFEFTALPYYQAGVYSAWFFLFLFALAVTGGDLIYFKYVNRHMTNELTFIFSEARVLLKTLFTTYRIPALLTVTLLLSAGYIFFHSLFLFTDPDVFPGYRVAVIRFFLIVLLLIYLIHGNGFSGKPIAMMDAHSLASRDQAAIIMNGLFSSLHSLYRSRQGEYIQAMDTESAVQTVIKAIAPYRANLSEKFPLLQEHSPGSERLFKEPVNIALIVIEGFSSHNIPTIFRQSPSPWNEKNIMPFLTQLASDSLLFPNFFSNGQRTLDMVHTLLTSIPRLGNSPLLGHGQEFSSVQYRYLPQLLREAGYKTRCFNGPWQKSIHMDSIASLTGFDSYHHGAEINRSCLKKSGLPASEVGAWDEHLFEFVYRELAVEKKPNFSLIFTATSHAPYDLPEREDRPFGTEGDLNRYFNCNRYLDTVLKDFFDRVDGNADFENTLFFITGDHTIFPLENRWETTSLFHLPLFIYNKVKIPGAVDLRLGSHMDLFPTLLHAAGFTGPMVNFGRSLFRTGDLEFSLMSQGNTIHATDGIEWLILPHILSDPESFRLKEGYFLEKTDSVATPELLRLTRSYYQTANSLFRENRYYPQPGDH